MARKDDNYLSFIGHELIQENYGIPKSELPKNLKEGLVSEHKILKSIALIVSAMEDGQTSTERSVYDMVSKYLISAV